MVRLPSVARERPVAREKAAGLAVRRALHVPVRVYHSRGRRSGSPLALPNGLPGPNDRGLDHTPTWGRTHWGGTLFHLLAHLEIRTRTNNNARGLEHALRGILAEGRNQRASLAARRRLRCRRSGDGRTRALRAPRRDGGSPHLIPLEEMWRQLGVRPVAERRSLRRLRATRCHPARDHHSD